MVQGVDLMSDFGVIRTFGDVDRDAIWQTRLGHLKTWPGDDLLLGREVCDIFRDRGEAAFHAGVDLVDLGIK